MLLYLVVIILGLMIMTFLGFVFHWVFHQKWSGRLNIAHMTHHIKLYPVSDFISDKYRDPKNDNTVKLFALMFAPLILTVLVLTIFQVIPLGVGLIILGEMGFVGWINNSMHDEFHLTNGFWHRFWFFKKLQNLHYWHHENMAKNYGIFSFMWDKILRTYKDGDIVSLRRYYAIQRPTKRKSP